MGYYGDSLAFPPFEDSYKREIYRHRWRDLFSTQVVKLPVRELIDAQKKAPEKSKDFKAPPPGFKFG